MPDRVAITKNRGAQIVLMHRHHQHDVSVAASTSEAMNLTPVDIEHKDYEYVVRRTSCRNRIGNKNVESSHNSKVNKQELKPGMQANISFAFVLYMLMIVSRSTALVARALSFKSRLSTLRMSSELPAEPRSDEHFMKLALRHAQHAARDTEVPIGAVIVDSLGVVLAASRNQVEATQDATAHAEIVVMRQAAQLQGTWRLNDCTLYSTLEPCSMCFAAIQSFRVGRLVYGARDTRLGACGSFVNLAAEKHPFHSVQVTGGLLAETSEGLLKRFFQSRRLDNRSGAMPPGSYWSRGMPSFSDTVADAEVKQPVSALV